MAAPTSPISSEPAAKGTSAPDRLPVPYGVNEFRLNARLWLWTLTLVAILGFLIPRLWPRVERFETNVDYRLPYFLSRDYWLYEQRLKSVQDPKAVIVVGDSVIWGEYVSADATLPHFLSRQGQTPGRFVNAGINGMFPLALEGLHRHFGSAVRNRKVLVNCNLLWMSSPKADLSATKEETFNHSTLVPQFSPRIPCYKADAQTRLTAVIERSSGFLSWGRHLQAAYFQDRSLLGWTLADDGGDPPRLTNSWRNPFRQIHLQVPASPSPDPDRGLDSPRHRPWNLKGSNQARFEWVPPAESLQLAAFYRLVELLQQRGNDVLVVVGPFNEAMIHPDSRKGYDQLHSAVLKWLETRKVSFVAPPPLAPELYADASHPLTRGYEVLAETLRANEQFRRWADR